MNEVMGYRNWMIEQGLSRKTVKLRVEFLEARLRGWGRLDLSPPEVADWLNQYGGWTRYTYFHHLSSIYAWMRDVDPSARDPLAKFRTPPTPRPNASPLRDDELEAVLSVSTGDQLAWVELGYLAGLRTHEMAKLRGEDVDQDTIHVIGKGGVEAWLPTHPQLWRRAQEYPRQGWWFPSVQARCQHVSSSSIGNRTRDVFRSLGIMKGSTHRLRHTFATHLSRNGVPTPVIQQMLRHRSLETTQSYIGVDAREMAAAVRTLLPAQLPRGDRAA